MSALNIKLKSKNGVFYFKNINALRMAYEHIKSLNESIDITPSLVSEFEKSNNVITLRSFIDKMENEELDKPSKKDSNVNYIQDEVLQLLISQNSRVNVNGKMYDLSISQDKISKGKKVKSNACKLYLYSSSYEYYDNNKKRVKLIGRLAQTPIFGILTGKVKSQRKKNNGNWKGHRTRLKIQFYGLERDNSRLDCRGSHPIGSFRGPKKRKRLSTSRIKWGGLIWLKQNEVAIGCTYSNSQFTHTIALN